MKKYCLLLMCVLCSSMAWANDEPTPAEQRAMTRTNLATEYYKRGAYAIAIEEGKKALESVKNFPYALNILALSYWAVKEDATSRSYFEQALRAAPKDPDINKNFGNFLCEEGEHRAGLARYDVVLANPFFPNQDQALVAAANCSLKAGDRALAKQYFQRAAQLQSRNPQVKYQLASFLLEEQDLPEAKRHFVDLMRIFPQPPAELLWLGVRIERAIGSKEAETRYAKQLQQLYPDAVETTKLLTGKYD